MSVVSVSEAKTHQSRLLTPVKAGMEVVISRRGRPLARLVRGRMGMSGRLWKS